MNDLFTQTPKPPLAERLRPHSLDEVVGQSHLIGENAPLRLAVVHQKPHSMILWGPPGVGKTTLAHILANAFDACFLPLSAVFSGVKDIRATVEKAEHALSMGKSTIVFVDEVHRFNKAQQDAFLPYVESGLFTFIGATTENPSFEVNSALLSRARVYTLNPLSETDLQTLLNRVFRLPEYQHIHIEEAEKSHLCALADADARRLLNMLDQLAGAIVDEHTVIDKPFLRRLFGTPTHRFDKSGDQFYEQISALHKSVRGSHPNAALYWLCRMLDGGADARYLARRIVRIAWEDIGLADPRAIQIANDAATTFERLGSPEGELALAQAVLYLASAAKSNAGYRAYNQARAFVAENPTHPVPVHLRNAPTRLMKELGYGKAYRYAHDEEYAYAAGENYMPEGVAEPDFYQPTERGLEGKIGEKLAFLANLDQKAKENE